MDLLYSIPVKKNFYLTASTACRFIKEIQQIDLPNYELYIYYEQEEASIHHILTEKQIPFHWIYLISSEKQYEDLENWNKYGNLTLVLLLCVQTILYYRKTLKHRKELGSSIY